MLPITHYTVRDSEIRGKGHRIVNGNRPELPAISRYGAALVLGRNTRSVVPSQTLQTFANFPILQPTWQRAMCYMLLRTHVQRATYNVHLIRIIIRIVILFTFPTLRKS